MDLGGCLEGRGRRAMTPTTTGGARRFLHVHEYQGADIMRKFGVRVPDSIACATAGEVQKASEQMKCLGDDEVVVKSQILAGGRGLGTFKSGFKGGVHIVKN